MRAAPAGRCTVLQAGRGRGSPAGREERPRARRRPHQHLELIRLHVFHWVVLHHKCLPRPAEQQHTAALLLRGRLQLHSEADQLDRGQALDRHSAAAAALALPNIGPDRLSETVSSERRQGNKP
jgi:hypothetical protein